MNELLGLGDVLRLQSLGTSGNGEIHRVAFIQGYYRGLAGNRQKFLIFFNNADIIILTNPG